MIIKNIKQIISEYFFVNPTAKLRVREIERALKLPLPSVIRYCNELEQEGILTTNKIGNANFYTSNRGSQKYILEKKLYNIKKIYESGLIEYLKRKIQVFRHKNIKEISNPHMANNIINGITLNNYIEVFK